MAYRIGEGPYKYTVTFHAYSPRSGTRHTIVENHRRKDEYELRALALGWHVANVEVLS
jgi:hypothetical protein